MQNRKKTSEKPLYGLQEVQVRLRLAEGRTLYSAEPMDNPDSAVRVVADALRELDREYFCVVNLDANLYPINFNIVSIGGINLCPVPIQNVFKASLLSNSYAVLLLHNHPSGSLNPSREDIDVTGKLIDAGELLEIPVMDHIIVGGEEGHWKSIREEYPDLFSGQKREIPALCDGRTDRSVLSQLKNRKEDAISETDVHRQKAQSSQKSRHLHRETDCR